MRSAAQYPHLLAEGKIGKMILRNRIVMPPMATNFAEKSGEVTERLIRYLERRAQGGVGLIIVEGAYISKEGKGFPGEVGGHRDELIPGLARLAKTVQQHGAKIALQLFHAGRQTRSETTGCPIVGPSAIPCPVVQQTPVALGRGQIAEIIRAFAQAARRAREAGFDAVEVHGAHGYLVHQFLSPLSNQRDDEYGGSKENRLRLAEEVVDAIREVVGPDFPILFRIDAEEFLEGGIDRLLAAYYCQTLAPRLEALHVTAGSYGSRAWIVQPYFHQPGILVPLAGEIKRKVKIPIIAVGRIHSPELAENVLAHGDADFIAIGRGLLADPDLPRKSQEGKVDEIMPCLSCYLGCTDRLRSNLDISCIVNPFVGKEHCRMAPLKGHPHCLIVGAGPAGMSAALMLAERGARVTLVEKRDQMGGQFLWATKVNFKQPFAKVIQLYGKRLEALGVNFLQREATADWVKDQKADYNILATGSLPYVPPIPGLISIKHMTFGEALEQGVKEDRVLILGGGATGCEIAEVLLSQGKKVILVEMLEQLASDLGNIRLPLLDRLRVMGLEAHTKTQVQEVRKDRILLLKDGKAESLEGIGCVILACGVIPNGPLKEELGRMGVETLLIGDCRKPQNGFWAIRAGFELGMALGG